MIRLLVPIFVASFILHQTLGEPQWITDNWYFIEKAVTWSEAVTLCQDLKYVLAVLPNPDEAGLLLRWGQLDAWGGNNDPNLVVSSIPTGGPGRLYWMGITDQNPKGKWIWAGIDEALWYEDYWQRKPGKDTKEHCGAMFNPKTHSDTNKPYLVDISCDTKLWPICDSRTLDELKHLLPEGYYEGRMVNGSQTVEEAEAMQK